MDTQNQTAVKLFKALSDPNRLAILALLREGEKCACVLLERLELTQPGLSYHMKVLCGSGLVESRQEGKWTHYRLSEEGRRQAVALLWCTVSIAQTSHQNILIYYFVRCCHSCGI